MITSLYFLLVLSKITEPVYLALLFTLLSMSHITHHETKKSIRKGSLVVADSQAFQVFVLKRGTAVFDCHQPTTRNGTGFSSKP